MYILRPFMRINRVKPEEVDEFVGLAAGHNLSIRDIELLANGYFKGSAEFRELLRKGDLALGLSSLRDTIRKIGRLHCNRADHAPGSGTNPVVYAAGNGPMQRDDI